MSISINSMGHDELESIAKKLITKENEIKTSENKENLNAELKKDVVTISEEGRVLSQDKEKSGTDAKQGFEKSEVSTKSGKADKADKAEKDDKAEGGAGAEGTGESTSEVDKLIEKLKKKIEQVSQSIQEISNSNMPDEMKQTLMGVKSEELALLNSQLQQMIAQKAKASKSAGGASSNFSVKI